MRGVSCFGQCAQYDAILFWKIGPLFLLSRQLFGSKTCDARNASLLLQRLADCEGGFG